MADLKQARVIDIEQDARKWVKQWEDKHRATRRIDGPLDDVVREDLVYRMVAIFGGIKELKIELEEVKQRIPPKRERKPSAKKEKA